MRAPRQHRFALVVGGAGGDALGIALHLAVYEWVGFWATLVFAGGSTAVWTAWRTREYPWIGRLVGCLCRPCKEK